MESFSEGVSERDDDDDWLEDSEEIEAIDKLLKKDEELKKLTAVTLYKPQVSQISSELTDPPDLGALSVIDPSSVSPSIHNALVLNKACQALLIQLEKKLEGLLEENLKKQRDLEKYMNSNRKDGCLSSNFVIKCVGMPYFKDLDGFIPPKNSDVLKKISKNELMPEDLAINLNTWSEQDQSYLKKSVINYVKDLKYKELSKKENELKKKGNIDINDYKAIIEEIEAVKNAQEESLEIIPEKIDWLKISTQDMKGVFTEMECESKWVLELDPKLNKGKWQNDEFDLLVKVAEKNEFQNWDVIAKELGTNRSSFQCCVQFHSKKGLREGKWTEEEVEKLVELHKKYKIENYVPWLKIAWYYDTRSVKQIKEKFQMGIIMSNKKTGRFSKIEDNMIIIGAKEFSNDFSKITVCLPERNVKQIRSRFDYLIGKYMAPFTKEEEEKLIKLVSQYSKNWKLISQHFENRSSLQCRKYWAVLEKSIREEELDDEDDLDWSELIPDTECEITNEDLSLVPKKKIKKSYHDDLAEKSAAYVLLLNYLHTCHDCFFGPRSRNFRDPDVATKLVYKVQIGMETLKVNTDVFSDNEEELNVQEFNSLSNLILNAEDETILYHLQLNKVFQEDKSLFMNKVLIPPNYTTLVGLRSLVLGRTVIQNFATATIPDRTGYFENRMTFEDAKELWKNRLRILFTLPILCSKIDVKPPKNYKTGRVIKPKPLSQRKKRAHALHLTEAKKLKRSLLNENDFVFVKEKPKPNPKPIFNVESKSRGRPRKDTEREPVGNLEASTSTTTQAGERRRTERVKKTNSRFSQTTV